MRKVLSILLVVNLIFIVGGGMALPEESREEVQIRVRAFVDGELEELVGLWVTVYYSYSSGFGGDNLYCEGKVLGRKGSNWLIIRDMKDFITWCYVPTIRKIMILSINYVPKFEDKLRQDFIEKERPKIGGER